MKTIEEIEKRLAEIKAELDKPEADLDALQEEVRSLTAEKAQIKANAQKAEELRRAVADGMGTTVETRKETGNQTVDEIRNSKRYIDAYAEFIKTGNAEECRSLLTVNATGGTLPVPVFLQEMIETAWERNEILSRVSRSYIKGNLQIPFELTADGAYIHPEGTTAPTEEALTFGLVTLTPMTIKKWVDRAAA